MQSYNSIFSETVLPLASAATGVGGVANIGEILWGFLFVVVVLALLALITGILGKIFVANNPSEPETKRVARASAAAAPLPEAEIEGEIVALITAAVHTVITEPHKIVSIRPGRGTGGWAQEGRRDISGSHRVR